MSTVASSRRAVQPRLRTRGLVVFVALLAGLAVWAVAVPVAGVDLMVGSGSSEQHVGPGSVVLVSLLAGLVGAGLLALFERVTPRPRGTWLIVSLAVLLLSLAGPFGAVTPGATVALACMHLAVGLTIALGLTRTVARLS